MTLGKVTDERGVEGGRQVALKRRGGGRRGDRQDRSQGLKYPLKDPRSRRVTSHDRETHEKVERAACFGDPGGRGGALARSS